jgi:hypothetical protein
MIRRVLGSILFVLVAALPTLAQTGYDNDPDGAQGYVNSAFHHASVDSVNLYNGQLSIPVTVGPRYSIGPKLKFQLALTYNSRTSDYSDSFPVVNGGYAVTSVLAVDPSLAMGWTFTLGAIKNTPVNGSPLPTYFGPDGSQHTFRITTDHYAKADDASQLLLHTLTDGQGNATGYEMWDGDGNRYAFGNHVTGYDNPFGGYYNDAGRGRDGWYVTLITDPFGNQITMDYYTATDPGPCWVADPQHSCTVPVIDTYMRCAPGSSWIPKTIYLPSGAQITIGRDTFNRISTFTFPVKSGAATTATWTLEYGSTMSTPACTASSNITTYEYRLNAIKRHA